MREDVPSVVVAGISNGAKADENRDEEESEKFG